MNESASKIASSRQLVISRNAVREARERDAPTFPDPPFKPAAEKAFESDNDRRTNVARGLHIKYRPRSIKRSV
jgi:hypothetical protein